MTDQTNGNIIVRLNKEESKLMRYIQQGCSKQESRPILNGIHLDQDNIVSADGFRIHSIPRENVPALADLPNGTYDFPTIKAGSNLIEVSLMEDGEYPDYKGILPKLESGFTIELSPRLLRDAAKWFDGGVNAPLTLRFKSDKTPVELWGKIDEQDAYALIMPMTKGAHPEYRPAEYVKVSPTQDPDQEVRE